MVCLAHRQRESTFFFSLSHFPSNLRTPHLPLLVLSLSPASSSLSSAFLMPADYALLVGGLSTLGQPLPAQRAQAPRHHSSVPHMTYENGLKTTLTAVEHALACSHLISCFWRCS